ncbi:sensor histidine kinase [Spirosoma pomorum]
MTYRLSTQQKWQLALSVFVVYLPIRIYINTSEFTWALVLKAFPFWILESVLSITFFFLWINVTEWLHRKVFRGIGEGFLIELKWPAQIFILLIASGLAVGFNLGFYSAWRSLDGALEKRFGYYREADGGRRKTIPTPEVAEERKRRGKQRSRANNGLTVIAMLSVFYLSANRRAERRLEAIQLRAERLEKESAQAQFAALKSQVNPHFLFNSLSILSSLVYVDAELSEKFIDQLSRAYRYILEQKDNDRIQLKTELEFIQAYRFLLNIRFEDKFDVIVDIPEADQSRYSIAPLTLQLLVENAVKHNRMSVKEPLQVYIELDGDTLIVRNNLQVRPQPDISTGVGLKNIINRYALLTTRSVWVGESDDQFVVKIPLL